VLALVALAAGCGSSSKQSVACHRDSAQAKRSLPALNADIAAIRRARTHDATSRATDRFIARLEHSGLSLTTENRLIDLAIDGTLGKCHDCFEALEAMRPIPSLQQHQCT
jgi:hypothetical protein